jgi:ribosome maturation factor RimP
MEMYTREQTFRKFINKLFRITQRVNFTKLSFCTTEIQSFKNKQIVKVYTDVNSRYLRKL